MTPLSLSFREAIPNSFCASALQLCDAAYPRPAHKSMTKSPRRSRSIGFEVASLGDNQEKHGFLPRLASLRVLRRQATDERLHLAEQARRTVEPILCVEMGPHEEARWNPERRPQTLARSQKRLRFALDRTRSVPDRHRLPSEARGREFDGSDVCAHGSKRSHGESCRRSSVSARERSERAGGHAPRPAHVVRHHEHDVGLAHQARVSPHTKLRKQRRPLLSPPTRLSLIRLTLPAWSRPGPGQRAGNGGRQLLSGESSWRP